MGLLISVYRDAGGDCSLNGISSNHDFLTVVNVEGPFEPSEKAPAVWLVPGNVPNSAKLVPNDPSVSGKRGMMGGNFGGTSDSRFRVAVEKLIGGHVSIVPIHDRFEG